MHCRKRRCKRKSDHKNNNTSTTTNKGTTNKTSANIDGIITTTVDREALCFATKT